MSKISVKNLDLYYGDFKALKNINLEIEPNKMAYAQVDVLEIDNTHTVMEILLYQGLNRQIRRMFEFLGFEVVSLKRIQHAIFNLDGLKRGEFKPIKPRQIKDLRNFLNRIAGKNA